MYQHFILAPRMQSGTFERIGSYKITDNLELCVKKKELKHFKNYVLV